MGSVHDIMQTFAGRDLHTRFPENDGWVWRELPSATNGDIMFRVTRGDHHKMEEALLAVSFSIRPSCGTIEELLAVPAGRMARRYLLVPQDTDLPDLAEGITLMRMAAFGVVDGKLTWLTRKNHAVRYSGEASAHHPARDACDSPPPVANPHETPASQS